MANRILLPLLSLLLLMSLPVRAAELWDHLATAGDAAELRGLSARFDASETGRVLHLEVPARPSPGTRAARTGIYWFTIQPPVDGWDLSRVRHVSAGVANRGKQNAEVTLWVVSANGWAAVGKDAVLKPGARATLKCDLRETYPDGTPKIDPRRISEIRVMIQRARGAKIAVSGLAASGTAEEWIRPPAHLDVPDMAEGPPAAGRRVRYQLPGEAGTGIYSVLHLPPDWRPGKRYPVIAEFPGNIFYRARACWSTGRPEQCQIGYGITRGTNAIWVSLPFVDRTAKDVAESGFGSRVGEDTTSHALRVVEDICANWGGDRDNLFLCGFSRGSIACGYIGLRNDAISGLWKGLVGCQHYDGSRWRESRMADAVKRAKRFTGRAIFQVDNSREKYQPVMDATNPDVKWTWTKSGLGYHATAMFLDDRPMMRELRRWFWELVAAE